MVGVTDLLTPKCVVHLCSMLTLYKPKVSLHKVWSFFFLGPYSSGASPVNSGNLPCYTSTPNILPRISQPCMTRGGAIRGTSRGGRILANGYRCQTTFKGQILGFVECIKQCMWLQRSCGLFQICASEGGRKGFRGSDCCKGAEKKAVKHS